jgi:hypothetical protein
MGLELKSNLFPYRLILSRKEPVELSVKVTNNSPDKKLVTMQIAMARAIALDRGGLKKGADQRLGEMEPGQSKEFVFQVFPKHGVKAAAYPIQIRLIEHFNSYEYIARKVVKSMELIVED